MATVADQDKFAGMVALLIVRARGLGYQVTLGDAFRDPRLHGHYGQKKGYGSPNSFHKLKLAIDINLFKNGDYLDKTEDHQELGEWWESIGGTWGGRWNDGNHYSLGEGLK